MNKPEHWDSEGQMPQVAAEAPRHHVHHSYIWLGSVRTFIYILVTVVIVNFSAIVSMLEEGDDLLTTGIALGLIAGAAIALLAVIFGLIALFQWLSWRHLFFTVGPDEFTLYKGILNKTQVHIPYQRVQSVDQRATLMQRIFGVCTLSIETAGGATNKAVLVPYLAKGQAEWLRSELYGRKAYLARQAAGAIPQAAPDAHRAAAAQHNVLDAGAEIWDEVGGVFAGGHCQSGAVSYEYGLSNKELFLAGVSGSSSIAVIMVGILAALMQAADLFVNEGAEDALINGAVAAAQADLTSFILFSGVILFAVVLVIWVLSAVGSCINYGGFKGRRREHRIEVEYGLLQHTFQGVDVDRVQSVVIKQSFIRRLMGYCEVSLGKVDSAAGDDDDAKKSLAQSGLVLHPFVKMDRVPELLAGMIPEYADLPRETIPVAPVATRRAIIRNGILFGGGFWLALVMGAGLIGYGAFAAAMGPEAMASDPDLLFLAGLSRGVFIAGFLLAAILFAINIANAVLWARESSFGYNRRFMQVSLGGFRRETVSFPRHKIQFGCTSTNPLQKRAGTTTIIATTAAGVGGTSSSLIDVRAEDGEAWLDWVKPRRTTDGPVG